MPAGEVLASMSREGRTKRLLQIVRRSLGHRHGERDGWLVDGIGLLTARDCRVHPVEVAAHALEQSRAVAHDGNAGGYECLVP